MQTAHTIVSSSVEKYRPRSLSRVTEYVLFQAGAPIMPWETSPSGMRYCASKQLLRKATHSCSGYRGRLRLLRPVLFPTLHLIPRRPADCMRNISVITIAGRRCFLLESNKGERGQGWHFFPPFLAEGDSSKGSAVAALCQRRERIGKCEWSDREAERHCDRTGARVAAERSVSEQWDPRAD